MLESGIANGEDFIEKKDVSFGADGNGESQANLHATGVVFEFLIHKLAKFGKIYDFVIHLVYFLVGKAEKGTVKVDVLAAGEVGVETDAKFDEWDEIAVDLYGTFFGEVDLGESFKESGFARAVTPDDADKLAFIDVEIEST